MTSEHSLFISVKERRPPSQGSRLPVNFPEHDKNTGRQSGGNVEQLLQDTLPFQTAESTRREKVTAEKLQGYWHKAGASSAPVTQRLQFPDWKDLEGSAKDSEELLDTEQWKSTEPKEHRLVFDLSGYLIKEPDMDKPFKIEETGSIQGIEKFSFSLGDFLTLTRSSVLQQRVAAVKAIRNIFLFTCNGTLSDEEAYAVFEEFESSNGPATLVDLIETRNYRILFYILEIASSLTFEFEKSLILFEERWNVSGLLEEDLEKLSWPDPERVYEKGYGFPNMTCWKKAFLVTRLIESFFLSKFLDKLQQVENLHALKKRAYHTLSLLFTCYVVHYWLQEQALRQSVALEVGKMLVKHRNDYDSNFLAKMINWCFIVNPTWKEGLDTVFKLDSESVLLFKIRSLRIMMHFDSESLLQFDLWSYLKDMIDTWKRSHSLIENLPARECILLCIEYCKLLRPKNVFLDNYTRDIFSDVFLLFEFLVHHLKEDEDEGTKSYLLLVSELLVKLFLGSSHPTRYHFEKNMEYVYVGLADILNCLESFSWSRMEDVEDTFSRDVEKQAMFYLSLKVVCLLEWTVHHDFSNCKELVSQTWTRITNYQNANNVYVLKHIYCMVTCLAEVYLERFLETRTLYEWADCLRLVSVVQPLGLFHICRIYFCSVFSPSSLSIAFSSSDDAKLLSLFLESQIVNILRNHKDFWWWTAQRTLFYSENKNNDEKQQLVLLFRFFIFLMTRTNVFESTYEVFFYKMMKQVLTGPENRWLAVEREVEQVMFYLLCYDSCHSCVLYLETTEPGSSLVDSLVDMAYRHLFSNDIVISKITDVLQTTIFHFLMNPSYREEFRLGLWRKCVKSNLQLCDPLWITGPLCQYVKPCTDDLCFIIEALGDICRGLVNPETCYFVYKSICIRIAKTVFEKPHYWHLLNVMLTYASVHDNANIIAEVFVSDFSPREENQTPKVYSQIEVFQIFRNANASEEQLRKRLQQTQLQLSSFHRLIQKCPFLDALYSSNTEL